MHLALYQVQPPKLAQAPLYNSRFENRYLFKASIRRILRELEIRQPDALIDDLIGVDAGGRFKGRSAGGGYEIVLIDAVAADAQAAHQHAVLIQRQRAGKKHDAVLIRIRRLRALRARIQRVEFIQRKKRTGRGAVDAGRIKRLAAEADGPVGHRGTHRNARQIARAGDSVR